MVIFELGTKISPIEKKLGREAIVIELSEWEMNTLITVLSTRSKQLYVRIVTELINEAKKEGYEMVIGTDKVEIKCPHCKEKVVV